MLQAATCQPHSHGRLTVATGLRSCIILLASTIIQISIPVHAHSQMHDCSTGKITISADDNPISNGIDCEDLTGEFTITFEENASIVVGDDLGIYLTGKGPVFINPHSVTGQISTTGANRHGMEVSDFEGEFTAKINKITTSGDGAFGINLEFDDPGKGNSSDVSLTVGTIKTLGDNAFGINIHGFDTSREFDVAINVNGEIRTEGSASQGVVVEFPSANIEVNVTSGGSIWIKPEHSFSAGVPTFAIALTGLENVNENKLATIINRGTISGSILTEGCAVIRNSGLLEQAATISISEADCPVDTTPGLFNSGIVRIGTTGDIRSTELTGDFHQDATGELQFDVDWAEKQEVNRADRLTVKGTASIEGLISVNHMSIPSFDKDNYDEGLEYTVEGILYATELVVTDLERIARDTILLDLDVRNDEDKNRLDAVMKLTGLDRLNRNERNAFWGMNAAREELHGAYTVFLGMLNETDLDTLRLDLDRVGNEISADTLHVSAGAAVAFDGIRHECRSAIANGGLQGCVVATPFLEKHRLIGNFEQRDHTTSRHGMSAGMVLNPEGMIDRIGLSFSSSRSSNRVVGVASSSGKDLRLGIELGVVVGPVNIDIGTHAGKTDYSIIRHVPDGEMTASITGKSVHRSTGLAGGIEIPLEVGRVSVTPQMRIRSIRVKSRPYTESGNQLALSVEAGEHSLQQFVAGVEVTLPTKRWAGGDIVPLAAMSMTVNRGMAATVTSSFDATDSSFKTSTAAPKRIGNISAGLSFTGLNGRLNGIAGISHSRGSKGTRMKSTQMQLAAVYNF